MLTLLCYDSDVMSLLPTTTPVSTNEETMHIIPVQVINGRFFNFNYLVINKNTNLKIFLCSVHTNTKGQNTSRLNYNKTNIK